MVEFLVGSLWGQVSGLNTCIPYRPHLPLLLQDALLKTFGKKKKKKKKTKESTTYAIPTLPGKSRTKVLCSSDWCDCEGGGGVGVPMVYRQCVVWC